MDNPMTLDDAISPVSPSQYRSLLGAKPVPVDNKLDVWFSSTSSKATRLASAGHGPPLMRLSALDEAPVLRIPRVGGGYLVVKFSKAVMVRHQQQDSEEESAAKAHQVKEHNRQHEREIAIMAAIKRRIREANKSCIPVFVDLVGRVSSGFVVEYFRYRDVDSLLRCTAMANTPICFPSGIFICQSVLLALGFLAKLNVVHGDLTLANFFIGVSGNVVLGDFGAARPVGFSMSSYTKSILGMPQIEAIINKRPATLEHDRTSASISLVRLFEDYHASAWDGVPSTDPCFQQGVSELHAFLVSADPPKVLIQPRHFPLLLPIVQALQVPSPIAPRYQSIGEILAQNAHFLGRGNQERLRRNAQTAFGSS